VDFTLSGEQEQFAAALHDMLADADVPAAARSWAAGDHGPGLDVWRGLAAAGVTALMVPEEHGGLGASAVDLVIACEEIGHHAVPGPAAESLAAVPALLSAPAVDISRLRYAQLPGLPQFSRTGTVKSGGEPADWPARLAAGDPLATLAAPPAMPYAADADIAGLVLLADPDGLWLAEPGTSHPSVDATRTLSEITGTLKLGDSLAIATAVARALDFGALASAAQLLGAGRALLTASVCHARERVQFGQPVGSFQAVKHQLADVLIGLEFARPLVFAAAVALAAHSPSAGRDVSAARVACADAARRAARTALQVHGAIGYTAEHDLVLWLTKVQALAPAWGSQAYHRARVLASLTPCTPRISRTDRTSQPASTTDDSRACG